MLMFRSVLFAIAFHANLALILIAMLPTLVMPRSAVFAMGRLWARTSLWLLEKICRLRVECRGTEHIPGGGFIIAPKHQSALETFALLPFFSSFIFVLKRELMRIPLFGWYLLKAGQIGIDRRKGPAALADVVRRAGQALHEGNPVFLFPEGTRRPVGAAPDYKPGIARVYVETGVPCLPVAVNTGLFWARRSLLRRPGTVLIEFLEPIPPGLDKRRFLDLLKSRVEQATQRLIAEAIAKDPSLADVVPTEPPGAPAMTG
ncbi:MAG: 1-acyl-sn-glycerol-3-phosphate acyltransferase [Methylobacteriaceae bacterium]|nr:1-acyl-sn-glycerol-3-phosphate acyltransferase [Methylobacteriaceae bacterium]